MKKSAFRLLWAAALAAGLLVVAYGIREFKRARTESARVSCPANLKAIEGAKAAWAVENKMDSNAVPTSAQLFGPTNYIRDFPVCPQGGTYTLNAVGQKASCSLPGHSM